MDNPIKQATERSAEYRERERTHRRAARNWGECADRETSRHAWQVYDMLARTQDNVADECKQASLSFDLLAAEMTDEADAARSAT